MLLGEGCGQVQKGRNHGTSEGGGVKIEYTLSIDWLAEDEEFVLSDQSSVYLSYRECHCVWCIVCGVCGVWCAWSVVCVCVWSVYVPTYLYRAGEASVFTLHHLHTHGGFVYEISPLEAIVGAEHECDSPILLSR